MGSRDRLRRYLRMGVVGGAKGGGVALVDPRPWLRTDDYDFASFMSAWRGIRAEANIRMMRARLFSVTEEGSDYTEASDYFFLVTDARGLLHRVPVLKRAAEISGHHLFLMVDRIYNQAYPDAYISTTYSPSDHPKGMAELAYRGPDGAWDWNETPGGHPSLQFGLQSGVSAVSAISQQFKNTDILPYSDIEALGGDYAEIGVFRRGASDAAVTLGDANFWPRLELLNSRRVRYISRRSIGEDVPGSHEEKWLMVSGGQKEKSDNSGAVVFAQHFTLEPGASAGEFGGEIGVNRLGRSGMWGYVKHGFFSEWLVLGYAQTAAVGGRMSGHLQEFAGVYAHHVAGNRRVRYGA